MSRFKFPRIGTGKKTGIFKPSILWSCRIQDWFWKRGISIHNPIRNECTQDFSCCLKKGDINASFFEALVAMASDAEKGKGPGILFKKKGVTVAVPKRLVVMIMEPGKEVPVFLYTVEPLDWEQPRLSVEVNPSLHFVVKVPGMAYQPVLKKGDRLIVELV